VTHQSPARRAHRRADGHVLLARRASDEQQVRQVGAGNEQDEDHGRHEDDHRHARLRHDVRIAERQHAHAETAVGERKRRLLAPCHFVYVRLRLLQAEAIVQERDARNRASRPRPLGLEQERHVELRGIRKVESGRHHADDGAANVVDGDAAADDARIAAVVALPEAVREDDRRFEAHGRRVGGRERSAQQRLYAKPREELRCDGDAGETFGLVIRHRGEAPDGVAPDVRKGARFPLDRQELRSGQTGVGRLKLVGRVQRHHLLGSVAKRQGAEQCSVDQAEDGHVGANADAKRADRGQEERGPPP
jgi:hypothetical protein